MPKSTSNSGKRAWKDVATGGSQFVKWSAGKIIEGVVKGFREYKFKKEKRRLMEVADMSTGEVHAIGEYAALSNLFSTAKKGDEVRIKLIGKKKMKGGKNPMLQFKVQIRQ